MEKTLAVDTIELSRANLAQLQHHAAIVMGIELKGKETKEDLRTLIENSGWPKQSIPILQRSSELPVYCDSDGTPTPRTFKYNFGAVDGKGGRVCECVKVLIPTSDAPGGKEPVPVAVNGKLLYIPRDKDVPIPIEYAEALSNAERFVYAETEDALNQFGLGVPAVVKTYPFSHPA